MMAYLRTLGFEPDVMEDPYYTRLKFLLFGCTRRVLIHEGNKSLTLTPENLKIVQHAVSTISLKNRYDTYCSFMNVQTLYRGIMPSYAKIEDAIPIV